MGNPLSPTLANIFMCKLEEDVVTPKNLPFYDRYVDDCFTKRKTNAPDTLFENWNSYHLNIKFTAEENPDHFLDTSFNYQDGNFITRVYQKPGKLQVHWKSAIPERWKRNTILGALHRAKRIATNWKEEIKVIKQSFMKSGYPAKIVNEVIHDFQNPRGEETIISVHWLDERTKLGIRLPQGRSQDLSKGAHTVSNIIVMVLSPRNIVGCFLKKRLTKVGSRAPQDPPPPSLRPCTILQQK